jgi:hypothetical protein
MAIADDFNDKVQQIWREHVEQDALLPALYPSAHFTRGLKLLVLGMNPAYDERAIQRRLNELQISLKAADVFGWSAKTPPRYINELLSAEQHAFKT